MRYRHLHEWDVTPAEAVILQKRLRARLHFAPLRKKAVLVAGIDVSYSRGSDQFYAGIVLYHIPENRVVEKAAGFLQTHFPYIPGLLAFREIPVILKAWEKVTTRPDCILCDGQGMAHPRRFGLACHLGLILDLPAIGCAKTLLTGTYREPAPDRGDWAALKDQEEIIGAVLRTRPWISPLYLSQGHKITLEDAIATVLSCQRRYRLPEPIRLAHQWVNQVRRTGDE